jgi:hypothetical protein
MEERVRAKSSTTGAAEVYVSGENLLSNKNEDGFENRCRVGRDPGL